MNRIKKQILQNQNQKLFDEITIGSTILKILSILLIPSNIMPLLIFRCYINQLGQFSDFAFDFNFVLAKIQ
jgi:hypothetical protein